MIRLLVVAAVRLYREGLAQVLDRRDDITVVGTAADWRAASEQAGELAPDIVLFDLTVEEGLDDILTATASPGDLKLIALGIPETEGEVLACAEAGVAGYITRDDSVDHLVAVIASVARNEVLCSPRMAAALLRRVAGLAASTRAGREARLTNRELEIVGLIEQGLSNKVIAQRLCIELATVKNHVHNILNKLDVTRRWEAPAELRRAGLGVRRLD